MPSTVRRAQCVFNPRRQKSQTGLKLYAEQETLISPVTRRPSHFLFVAAETSFTSATSPTNSCPSDPRNPRRISTSVLQIPASRTRTSAHLGRNFGTGFEIALNFPCTMRKESTGCLTRFLLILMGLRFCRQSRPHQRRHFLHQIELGLQPHQPAVEVCIAISQMLHLCGQRFHPLFDQHDFPDGRNRIPRPAHLPFLRCFRTRSTYPMVSSRFLIIRSAA